MQSPRMRKLAPRLIQKYRGKLQSIFSALIQNPQFIPHTSSPHVSTMLCNDNAQIQDRTVTAGRTCPFPPTCNSNSSSHHSSEWDFVTICSVLLSPDQAPDPTILVWTPLIPKKECRVPDFCKMTSHQKLISCQPLQARDHFWTEAKLFCKPPGNKGREQRVP